MKSFQIKLTILLLLLVFSVLIAFTFGSTEAWNDWIIFESRMPHVVGALLAGSALAMSGHFMQWIFRNPLAGPSVLGVTNGASLGIAMLMLLPASLGTWFGSQFVAAFTGAMLVLLLMAIMSRRFSNVAALLIIGMLLAHLTGALETILLRFSSNEARTNFVFWGMGSLDALQLKHLILLFFGGLLPLLPLSFAIKSMHAYALGDEIALTSGVNVSQLRTLFFLSIGVSVSTITACCGPLVFVGFVAPHIARIYLKSGSLYKLNFFVPLVGALFLVLADLCSRYFSLPINAVLALAGLPVMIYLLLFSKYAQSWIS